MVTPLLKLKRSLWERNKLELVQQYLNNQITERLFWIATPTKEIKSVPNKSIIVKKSDVYYKKYRIDIVIEKETFNEMNKIARGWEKRFPKAIFVYLNKKIEDYELTYLKHEEQKDNLVKLIFMGEAIDGAN